MEYPNKLADFPKYSLWALCLQPPPKYSFCLLMLWCTYALPRVRERIKVFSAGQTPHWCREQSGRGVSEVSAPFWRKQGQLARICTQGKQQKWMMDVTGESTDVKSRHLMFLGRLMNWIWHVTEPLIPKRFLTSKPERHFIFFLFFFLLFSPTWAFKTDLLDT